ncbi:MAG: hypothetical protein ACLT5P_10495 [Flavonifractor plautii]
MPRSSSFSSSPPPGAIPRFAASLTAPTSVEVYHNLISTVRANLDKMHRYVRLGKKPLGLEEPHLYDVYAPWSPG